jgi:TolB-like protein
MILFGYFFIPKVFKSGKTLEKSIAVLPFKSLSDDPNNQYLADGMMDAILLHLSKIKVLRVLPRTSVEQYRETKKAAHIIGKELDVEYLLEGSFQKYGDNARLIVQLIRASKESHLWANEYTSKWSEVFSVQSGVAQTIAKELYASITPEEKKLIEKVPTRNMTAYELYWKANDFKVDYQKTRQLRSYQNAVTFYKAALGIDSTFAIAYVGLARTYWNRYYWESYFKEVFMDSCIVLLNKALSIDNQLEEAYLLKGQYYYQIGDIDKAIENCDNTLKFNPNNYLAYQIKGVIYYNTGDIVASLDNMQKALKFVQGKSRPSVLLNLSWTYKETGFLDKGNYYAQEAFKLDSNKFMHLYQLAFVEFANENFEEAVKIMKHLPDIDSTYLPILMFYNVSDHKDEAYLLAKKMIERNKKSGAALIQDAFQIGYAFWQMGNYKEAKDYFILQIKYGEELMRLKRDASQWGAAQYDLASTYCFLGDKEKAYEYLDELDKLKFYQLWFIAYVKHNPLTKTISNEERYQKIIKNMEAKNQAEHERIRKWLEETGQL